MFRYKTATPAERAEHRAELKAKHENAKIVNLSHSALRFIQNDDYKRGCRQVTQFSECQEELIRLVKKELSKGGDHIYIPRKVAKAYITED